MNFRSVFAGFGLISIAFLATSCMEQYNPRPQWKQFSKERETAHREMPQLNDDGTLPKPKPKGDGQAAVDPIVEKYNTLCASCHGTDGKAETAAAKGLNPRPRNFTDLAWQNKTDDERIYTVIAKGGTEVGLAATMAAFGSLFANDDEINEMVKYVRSFGEKK